MGGMQNLEFKTMLPTQDEAVSNLVKKAFDAAEENGFTPQGQAAFERYISKYALKQRGTMGYSH